MSKDFIPAPASQPTPATTAESQPASGPTLNIDTAGAGLGTTQLVIAVAIVLALAAALYFVRGGVKSALVSSRATLDAANLAASAWYVFLLLLSGLVVFGLLGGLFNLTAYTAATAGLAVVGLAACGVVTGNARKTRK